MSTAWQWLSSCPTDEQNMQYKFSRVFVYFCTIWQSWGLWPTCLHISHHNPPVYGSGLGAPLARYCTKTGHCSFECPSVRHLVHHIYSRTSFSFFKLCSSKVMLTSFYWSWSILNADLDIGEASNLITIFSASLYEVTFCCISGNWICRNSTTINHSWCCCTRNAKLTCPKSVLNRWSKSHTDSCGICLITRWCTVILI